MHSKSSSIAILAPILFWMLISFQNILLIGTHSGAAARILLTVTIETESGSSALVLDLELAQMVIYMLVHQRGPFIGG